MGRPPCCDKAGIKKGPWTPEEDIILVSYIQEHGPGNWRSVPTNTGLSRCSKSCRLRWTNYLRPGIKRGNFTPHEEGMIIHLQVLLGNKWAAIASYLPQRTDNDIKNYWNTHLKKKLKKFQAGLMDPPTNSSSSSLVFASNSSFHDHLDMNNNNNSSSSSSSNNNNQYGSSSSSLRLTHSQSSSSSSSITYASSTENISRLLQGWMRSSPNNPTTSSSAGIITTDKQIQSQNNNNNNNNIYNNSFGENKVGDLVSHEEFDYMLSFENLNNNNNNGAGWDKSTCDSEPEKIRISSDCINNSTGNGNGSAAPLSFLEKWLFEENVGHEEMMELSPMF